MSDLPRRPRSPALASQTLAINQALADSEPLALLSRRMQQSKDRFAAITPLLPTAMLASVRAGPIDEAGWSLLASSSAVAAKLRQMQPALDAHLLAQGFVGVPLRVKLLGPA